MNASPELPPSVHRSPKTLTPLFLVCAALAAAVVPTVAAQSVPCPDPGSVPVGFRTVGPAATFTTSLPQPETWLSDGSVEGTRTIAEICNDACGGDERVLDAFDAGILVGTSSGLWLFDADLEGAHLLRAWPAGTQVEVVIPAGPRAFLQVGREVWGTDGTPAGTRTVFTAAAVNPVSTGDAIPLRLRDVRLDNELFFFAASAAGPDGAWHLWTTRGLAPAEPIRLGVLGPLSNGPLAVAAHSSLAFFYQGAVPRVELWATDGSDGGTRLVVPVPSTFPGSISAGDQLAYFFTASSGLSLEVQRTDGTAAGTSRVAVFAGHLEPVFIGKAGDGALSDLLLLDGYPPPVIPQPETATLFGIDGQGVRRLADRPWPVTSPVVSHQGRVFFSGFDATHGYEPWVTDGTIDGTRRVLDWCPGACSSQRRPIASLGAQLFLLAAPDGPGGERGLWVFDDLDAAPRRLTPAGVEIGPVGALERDDLGAVAGGRLLFAAGRGDHREVWVSDGTTAGTHELVEGTVEPPPVPAGPWLESSQVPGFRVKVVIEPSATTCRLGALEPDCIAETMCVSGAVPGRTEVFVRVVGPKPNGFLWPTLFRATTSEAHVWIEQIATGEVQYYLLPGVAPGRDELDGLFDRAGFRP